MWEVTPIEEKVSEKLSMGNKEIVQGLAHNQPEFNP